MGIQKSIDYSIIIPAFNEEDYLPATLAQIQRSMTFVENTGEIIVVDNNSDDRTAKIAKEYGAQVVADPKQNIGRARNLGAQASSGKVLIFIDADTVINDNSIKETLELLDNEQVIAGGGLLKPMSFHQIIFCYLSNRFIKKNKLFTGFYIFFKREFFLKVNGFNEEYYAGEDLEIFRKLKSYAKTHNKIIAILKNKIKFSDRKAKWFGLGKTSCIFLRLKLHPELCKSKKLCREFWYERKPKNK